MAESGDRGGSVLNALVIGCGNIAGRYDAGREGAAESPLTHAGAYRCDGRYSIAGCIEPDLSRREDFMRRWNVAHGFESVDSVMDRVRQYDVISVCSPTRAHAAHLRAAARLQPRLVFCEKPLTESSALSRELIDDFGARGIALAVNYTRRWDPSVHELKEGIAAGRWGKLRTVVGGYNKGLLNNGSHMLDLLLCLLGAGQGRFVGDPIADHAKGDPSVPAWLEASGGVPVVITCSDARDFAYFELELIFSDAILRMEEGGLYWRERPVAASAHFAGYRVAADGPRAPGRYGEAMRGAVANIYDAVTRGAPLASTGSSALSVQRLCEQLGRP
jgi:predicted dehydrogenase